MPRGPQGKLIGHDGAEIFAGMSRVAPINGY